MSDQFDLVVTADYPSRTAEFRLRDGHGSEIADRRTDFNGIAISRQQGLFDLRHYLRHYVEDGKEAASVAEMARPRTLHRLNTDSVPTRYRLPTMLTNAETRKEPLIAARLSPETRIFLVLWPGSSATACAVPFVLPYVMRTMVSEELLPLMLSSGPMKSQSSAAVPPPPSSWSLRPSL
jgi:hypothetical protein